MQFKSSSDLWQAFDALLASHRLPRLICGAILFLSGFLVLAFIYAAARRMRYPFDLEWIESGVLTSVQRISQGKPLYTRPTLDFIPYVYAPFYFYLAAALSKMTGLNFATLRLVSSLATLGSFGLIYLSVQRETRNKFAASAAVGLYAGMYAVVGGFFDIGRVDALFVFTVLLALFLTRRGHPVVAALAWALAVQTKQSVLPVALVMLCADWDHPRRILAGVATYISAVAASIALLNHLTHGWYSFYVFGIFGGLGTVWRQVALYIPMYLLAPLSLSFVLNAAAVALTRPRLLRFPGSFYLLGSAVLYSAYWYVAAHRGVFNTMMPLYAWTAILLGISVARLSAWLDRQPSAYAQLSKALLLLMVLAQLSMLVYNPGQFIPPPDVLADRRAFIRQLASLPGDVYVANHSWDAVMAGKQPHAEFEALGLLLDGNTGAIRAGLRQDIQSAVDSNRFGAFVLDQATPPNSGPSNWQPPDFLQHYPLAIAAYGADHGRYLTSQPQWIALPCSGLETSSGGRPAYITSATYLLLNNCSTPK